MTNTRTPLDIAPITRRLLKLARAATPAQVAEGQDWYCQARKFVADLHTAYAGRYSVEQLAYVVAAVSPNLRWSHNKRVAAEYVRLHAAGMRRADWQLKLMIGSNMRKAEEILDGDLSALSGPKVTAFAANILGDESLVTIDRWHMVAALGENRVPTARERVAVTAATERCALALGWTPAACQAVLWVAVRGTGA